MNLVLSVCMCLVSIGVLSEDPPEAGLTGLDVIERMKQHLTCTWSEQTVDTFKAGKPEQQITGIACTFTATMNVLKHAVEQGCNLIITHEPTYYNHLDSREGLENDPVYAAKLAFIEAHELIIFRFHDHWHRTTPDGIYVGMNRKMQWDTYLVEGEKNIYDFPQVKLSDVSTHLKAIFPDANLRVIGDPKLKIRKAAFSAGAPGSAAHFRLLQRGDIQLLVIGEAPEWETIEYVRDAVQSNLPLSLIILGHSVSEEAGMEYCAEWLRTFITELPVFFIPAGDPFQL